MGDFRIAAESTHENNFEGLLIWLILQNSLFIINIRIVQDNMSLICFIIILRIKYKDEQQEEGRQKGRQER